MTFDDELVDVVEHAVGGGGERVPLCVLHIHLPPRC
jgi:hypothetical protein